MTSDDTSQGAGESADADADADYDLIATLDGVIWKTHGSTECAGEWCVVHNPSDHHMRTWPVVLRDGGGRTERTCNHGIGHPDPDHLAYVRRRHGELQRRVIGVHGCDGCCYAPHVASRQLD